MFYWIIVIVCYNIHLKSHFYMYVLEINHVVVCLTKSSVTCELHVFFLLRAVQGVLQDLSRADDQV